MEDAAYYAAAAAAGIIGGWTFALIWARLVPSSVQGQFWSTMPAFARGMLAAERSSEFIDLYRRLGVALLRYLRRNVGGLILAGLPVAVLTIALSAWVFERNAPLREFLFFGMSAIGAVGTLIVRRKPA